MKKILTIIVLLAVIFFLFLFDRDDVDVKKESDNTIGTNFQPDPSSAAFTFDDGVITLSKGKSVNPAGEETSLLEERAYGDLNGDKKNDTVILLARSGGGSGVFIYTAAYVSGPVNYKGSNTIFLGDRIAPKDVSLRDGVITVTYLDRRDDEPFAAEPTVSKTMKLVYRNGELVER